MNKFSLSIVILCVACANFSCSPEAERQTIKPYLPSESIVEDNVKVYDPAVDILFVVDNSGSMLEHQSNFARNIGLFTSAFSKNSFLEYHIGVITTDSGDYGRLYGQTRVVTKNTPYFDQVLASNLLVGTNGSGYEEVFGPSNMAFTPSMLAGWNQGFYRQNATLVLVFITDAEDQSQISGQQLLDALVLLKNGNAKKVLAYGAIIPSSDLSPPCRRDGADTPVLIEQFLALVPNGANGKNIMHLCSPDFGTKLAEMAKDIVDQVGKIIYLDRMPDVSSIKVMFGNALLPSHPDTGWVFDPARNAVILGDHIDLSSQPPGSTIKVLFNAATVPNKETL